MTAPRSSRRAPSPAQRARQSHRGGGMRSSALLPRVRSQPCARVAQHRLAASLTRLRRDLEPARRRCGRSGRAGTCPPPSPPDARTSRASPRARYRRPWPRLPDRRLSSSPSARRRAAVARRRRSRRRRRSGRRGTRCARGCTVVFSQTRLLMSPESTSRGFSISRPAGRRSTSRMRPPVSGDSTFSTTTRRSFCLSLARAAGGAREVHLLAVERVVGALDGEALGDGRLRRQRRADHRHDGVDRRRRRC